MRLFRHDKYYPDDMKPDEVISGKIEMRLWFDGVEQPDLATRLFTNGRFTGFIVEAYAASLVGPNFAHVDANGFDLKALTEGRNIEVKSFTAYGAKLGPSSFYGAGRKPDPILFETEIAPSKDYIIVDQTKMASGGEVELVFKRGPDVAKIGHSISFKNRHLIFENHSSVDVD